jgi:hypothetical protein
MLGKCLKYAFLGVPDASKSVVVVSWAGTGLKGRSSNGYV